MRYPLHWFPLSDCPKRCIRRITRGCDFIGHLSLYTDLVTVEVVGLLVAFSVFINEVSIGETACVRYTTCIFRLQLAVV